MPIDIKPKKPLDTIEWFFYSKRVLMKLDDQIIEIYKLRKALNDLRSKVRLNQLADSFSYNNLCSGTQNLLESSKKEVASEQSQYLMFRTTALLNKEYNLIFELGLDTDSSGIVLYRNDEEDECITLFWAKNSSGLRISELT